MNTQCSHRAVAMESLEERRMLSAAFAAVIDNPYLPMIPGSRYVYKGTDDEDVLKITIKVTNETREIQGVTTTVVREREFENGELVEDTLDFFAQDKAGNVWYFGEESRDVEDGVLVPADDSWLAGVNGAKAGIIMKAHPRVGDAYQQENAPGVAEDEAEVVDLNSTVKVPVGTFGGVLRIEESNPLEPDDREHKLYAAGLGLIKAKEVTGGDEVVKLVKFTLPPAAFPDPLTIEKPNAYFPLVPGTTHIYKGSSEGEAIKVRTTVTSNTRVVDGVRTLIVRDKEFESGELVEDTRDFFAQDVLGNVWYFGEDSREIEDGKVVSTEGSWEAGVNGARRGIIMRAQPAVGDFLQQENAPGIAEDQGEVLSFGHLISTRFGTFGDSVRIAETTPLEPDVLEYKFYAPGIGLVMAQDIEGGDEVLELVDIRVASA